MSFSAETWQSIFEVCIKGLGGLVALLLPFLLKKVMNFLNVKTSNETEQKIIMIARRVCSSIEKTATASMKNGLSKMEGPVKFEQAMSRMRAELLAAGIKKSRGEIGEFIETVLQAYGISDKSVIPPEGSVSGSTETAQPSG